jgi:hypothetical protein
MLITQIKSFHNVQCTSKYVLQVDVNVQYYLSIRKLIEVRGAKMLTSSSRH